jgi:copper chaperone CopZ
MTIEREVAELEGVSRVKADAADRTVTVAWNDAETAWSTVEERLVEINFPPVGG